MAATVVWTNVPTTGNTTTYSWNSNNVWTGNGVNPPFSTDTGYITNNLGNSSTSLIVTQQSGWGAGGIVVSNSSGGSIQLIMNTGSFGFSTVVIGSNATFQIGNGGSLNSVTTFTLNSGGTLALNNGKLALGNGNAITINGTVIADNNGTLDGSANNNSFVVASGGQLIANTGTMYVNSNDGFSNDGLTINSGGTIQINSGATFVLNRSNNAWNNDSNPDNAGNINLNGGTFTVHFAGSQASDRGIQNSGTILGQGTLAMRVAQSSTGQTIASNGVLNIFQFIAGNQQTFTSDGGGFGTFKAVSGGTLKINSNVVSGFGGSWLVDSGGTIEIASITGGTINNVDLGSTVMQGSNFNGTVKVNSGANLTFSSAANGSALLSQSGTFEFVATNNGPATMNMPGVSGLNTFTNNGVFLLSGTGTGSGSWNGGVVGNSYAFINASKIDLKSGGTFTINSLDATTTGFSNTTAGTIFITNGATLKIGRTTSGWGGDTPVNMGMMTFSNGAFQTSAGAAGTTLDQSRLFKNAGTILVQGAANVTNYWQSTMQNAGTILITNNNAALQLGTSSAVNWFTNTSTGVIILGTNGASASLVATNGANGTQFSNLGTIQGQGTLTLGRNNATGGENANYQNSGMLIATNWGGVSAGTLFISVGNAFSNGGFSNTSVGTIQIASNSTLTVNRSQNAWAGSGNSVANLGTISLAGGVMNLASDGIVSNAASFINSGTISGWGTIDSVVITTNGGKVFANATNLLAGVGTLTLRVASATNNSSSTLGTIGTNAVLNLIAPGAQNTLINFGTISVSGGTINFGGAAGTITNFFVVAGVGNLSSFDIVNTGVLASIVAQNPIPGLSNLVASIGVTNSTILGANNSGGAATLTLDTATGGGLVNNGTIFNQGAFLTVTNAAGVDAGITNLAGIIYGFGTNLARVANLSGGTVMASNGVFVIGVENNLNLGTFTNLNASSTLRLTNSILVNSGKVFLSGGGLVLSGSSITNTGTITGPGDISSSLYNDTTGFVAATNGVLNIATNSGESVVNLGTFDISSASTLSNAPAFLLNSNGTIRLNAGTLTGGLVTNKGGITGNGTIMSAVVNATEGTVRATNGVLVLRQTAITQSGTMIGGTAAGTYVQATNLAGFFVNSGAMLLDGSGNLAYYLLADFSNAPNATITGAGILRTADNVIGGAGANFNIRNMGNIMATNGTLIVDSGDGFSFGFNNGDGATVTVANASTFGIARSTNAWLNSGNQPVNNGVIQLAGGTVATYTNTGTGVTATPVVDNTRMISNSASGTIVGFGTWSPQLNNRGTVVATNGTLTLANTTPFTNNGTLMIQAGATLTMLQNSGSFQNNGTMLLSGGTYVATNFTQFHNSGTISGFGTINTGTATGQGGANARIVNSGGTIIATNGTLFVNPGDAFSISGFSNSASARIIVAAGAAFVLNRTAHAWNNDSAATNVANIGSINLLGGSWSNYADGVADSSRFVKNVGTIIGNGSFFGSITNVGTIVASNGVLTVDGSGRFAQSGTLTILNGGTLSLTNSAGATSISFTNGGNILMRGGELQAGVIANTNVIFGSGTISGGGVDNSGAIYASNGTLVVGLASFTNTITSTLGTLNTNATLDATIPGGVGQPLINQGTINLAGGTLLFNGSASGTISNRTTGNILGVGNVTQTVVNNGTIMAANPVSGLSIFSVGLSDLNGTTATLGASNNATLNIVLSGGAGSSFNNNGSISMLGGALIISNATPGVITNNAFVSGNGSITPFIVNNSNIVASVLGGTLQVSMLGETNTLLGNLRAGLGATLVISNGLINLGTIGASGTDGGTITLLASSGILTNRGVISGNASAGSTLAINSFVRNDAGGLILATNGVLAFNGVNGLYNTNATIRIDSSGTLQSNSSNSWANAGAINMFGGTLRTGGTNDALVTAVFTNTGSGIITGYGTLIGGGFNGGSGAGFDKSIVNLGTIIATNPLNGAAQTLFINTGLATSQNGINNLGTMIVSSNNTLSLNRDAGLALLNAGTIVIQNGTLTGSGILSNDLGGIIQGYGTLSHQIVNASGGTIRATNGLMVMTASVSPVNSGTLEIDNAATMTWNATNSWQNFGTIDLRGGTLRTGGPTNAAAGGEPFTNSNFMVGSGTIIGGGAFNTNGPGIDKAIVNLGTIIASNVVGSSGTLIIDTGVSTLSNGIANLGTMIVATNNTLELRRAAEALVGHLNFIENRGTILINGGTLMANSALTNRAAGALPGLIQGFGHVAITNDLINSGTIRSTNGILHFVNPTGGDALDVRQSGTLAVELGSEMIFGASSNAPLVNSGTVLMNGGILRSGAMTNVLGATFTGFGTITSPTIINAGTGMATSLSQVLHLTGGMLINQSSGVIGAKNGQLVVDGVFTNAGTVSFLNSIGTFNSAVVNQGAWVMDPSTNVYNGNYTVATNGYITMTAGDVSIFKSNFYNSSHMSNQYDTSTGKFVFDQIGTTQQFYVAGLDLGGSNAVPVGNPIGVEAQTNAFFGSSSTALLGYSNNFALGTLEIGSLTTTSTLSLLDTFGALEASDGNKAALYVDSLIINPGSLLIISNNVELYFKSTNAYYNVTLGGSAAEGVLILGNGSYHQLVVPEPSILMLLMLGAAGIYWRRRRKH